MPNFRTARHTIRLPIFYSLAFILLLVLLLPGAASAAPLVLSDASKYDLAGHLSLFVDTNRSLELKDILTPAHRSAFKPVPGYINQGYTTAAVWVAVSLLRKKPFSDEVYLHLWPPYLDNIDVYVQQGDDPADPASYKLISLGDHVSVTERPIRHPEFIAPFILPEKVERTVYIKLTSSSTINFFASVHNNTDMISHGILKITLNSGYLAIALVISIINLIYYIRLGDRLYLYFALYILAIFVNHIALTGILTLAWPTMAHLLSDYFVGVGIGLMLIFFSLFGIELFNTRKSPWTHRFFLTTIVLGSSTFFSVAQGWYNSTAPLLISWSLIIIFVLTWLSCRRVFRGSAGGKLYLMAFGASNIGYLTQFLRVLGLAPVAWWNMYAMQVGSIFNMVLMTLALTERVYNAEQKALVAAREAEQQAVILAEEMTMDIRRKQGELEIALHNERSAMLRKKRFISMINHEYRNPLAIIQTTLSVLELRIGNLNIQLSPLFTKVRKAMERLVEVLETSMDQEVLADTIDRNTQTHQDIFISIFFKQLLSEIKNLWPDKHFHADIGDMRGKTLNCDRILLKTACFNLIANAFNYSPPEQSVSLSARAGESELTICITDHGCGIPVEQLDHVFELNYRGSHHTGISGKGVGLYLVKSIIEQFGGTIRLESTVGVGTVATVTLPLSTSVEDI